MLSRLGSLIRTNSGLIPMLIGLCLCTGSAAAQDLEMVHKPPTSSDLPAPGLPIHLSVYVDGLKNPDPQIRAFMVLDGRLIDAPLKGTYDVDDDVVYEMDVRAPIAELAYQFVLYESDGETIVSKKFRVQRPCLPNIKLTEAKIDPSIMKDERIKVALDKAKGLEADIRAYSNAVDLMKELLKQEQERGE